MDLSGTECARARESVSADLDRELQELDLRRLQAHLRVCADCSTWAEHVTATTAQLREAPFEMPTASAAELPHRGRGRTRRVSPLVALGSAAALAASIVVSLSGAQHGLPSGTRTTSTALGTPDSFLVRNSPSIDLYYRLPTLYRVFQPV